MILLSGKGNRRPIFLKFDEGYYFRVLPLFLS